VDYVEKHTGEKTRTELISPPGKEPLAEEAKPKSRTTGKRRLLMKAAIIFSFSEFL